MAIALTAVRRELESKVGMCFVLVCKFVSSVSKKRDYGVPEGMESRAVKSAPLMSMS
jgi:hypothetical protein